MTAGPTISDVLLTKTATQLFGSVFISNTTTGASGMVKISLHNYVGGVCQAELTSITECTPVTSSSYISNLRHLASFIYNSASLSNACVRTYICSTQTTCPTCTTYSTGYYNSMSNIVVNGSLGIFPDIVTGMNATVGSGTAVIKFTPPSNTYVTYYEITLTQGTSFLVSNLYINYNSGSGIPISNLTNGVQYRLAVRPLSDDGYIGPSASVYFTSVAPCTTPTCGFSLA